MKRRLSKGPALVLFAIVLTIQIVLLLAHMNLLPTFVRSQDHQGVLAGEVSKSRNQLRRRNLNSLVWEKSQTGDALYYHDSVLTLKESTSVVTLLNKTEVELSENTLVTIEPPDSFDVGEIRLKFLRGNLQARNPFSPATVQAEEWTVSVQANSEVEMFSSGDGAFELQVRKGEVAVKSPHGESVANANQVLQLSAEGATRFDLSSSRLAWKKLPARRIYSHQEVIKVPLGWQGEAKELILQTLGQAEKVLPLGPSDHTDIELGFGHHRMVLRSQDHMSAPFTLQIWRAPQVHLLAPLPRDRFQIGEAVNFMWTQSPLTASYRWQVRGEKTNLDHKTEDKSWRLRFDKVEDVSWSVFGLDSDGFEVPPVYEYPLFLRDDPFAPPQINSPQIRQPATKEDRGAWLRLWSLILPQAMAEEPVFEATFSWQAVEGANQYVIEISESEDFRAPVVMQTIKKTSFTWKDFAPRVYWWRVAAGHSRGRLGRFTPPLQIGFQKLLSDPDVRVIDGIEVRNLSRPPKSILVPVAIENAQAPSDDDESAPAIPELRPAANAIDGYPSRPNHVPHPLESVVFWQPRFALMQIKGESEITAKLTGFVPLSIAAEGGLLDSQHNTWRLQFRGATQMFKPKEVAALPFQDEIRWQDFGLLVTRIPSTSHWGWGVSAKVQSMAVRADNERMQFKDEFAFGALLGGDWQFTKWRFLFESGFSISSSSQNLGLRMEARWRLSEKIQLGVGLQGDYQIHSDGHAPSGQSFLSLGTEF